jgi:hypothetical protein
MPSQSAVEKALANLRRLIQRPPTESSNGAMTKQLPLDLTGGEAQHIGLLPDEVDAMGAVKEALLADLGFEHLRSPDDVVWRFVAQCWLDKAADHVPGFITEHRRDPADRVCFIPVEHLSVEAATEILGVRLLPLTDPSIPHVGHHFVLQKPVGCVATVSVRAPTTGSWRNGRDS